jgi:hypothetical protein
VSSKRGCATTISAVHMGASMDYRRSADSVGPANNVSRNHS